MTSLLPDYVVIGRIDKARGLKGEIKVRPLTDQPERFHALDSLLIEFPDGKMSSFDLERVSVQNNGVYLKLSGVENRNDAELLRGAYLNITSKELIPLEGNEFYFFEVLGFQVLLESGEKLGEIKEVMDLPAHPVLRVCSEEREYLIPVIPDVINRLERDRKTIVITPLDGLLSIGE